MRRRAVLTLALCAWLGATAVLFVWPREDDPTRADAVVVLSGSGKYRLPEAVDLMRARVAPTLVISNGRQRGWRDANRLCRGQEPFRVVCFQPKPDSTHGEAEGVARIARSRGWNKVVVVTSRFHVTRARMLFNRCFDGEVATVGTTSSPLYYPVNLLGEWGKLLYQLTLERDC